MKGCWSFTNTLILWREALDCYFGNFEFEFLVMLKVFQISMTSEALDKIHDCPAADGASDNDHVLILADDGCVGHEIFLIAQNGAQGYPVLARESKA
ncbi:hypothetical protein PLA107_031220 (plasmid) [Pseudomonas amygdali pv. lachrymans str. M301315]|uniref:Uncharacterized protein n=1 Tax=Pseudomonas amygdali pv. lachrymans str. M301315 TaxID=629260 RepID=A0AAD0PVV3_PSEAV|nr:hypothetical protein PLA107_031220 [Pseudomonas amygdali pv. lachrymans str. M301315]